MENFDLTSCHTSRLLVDFHSIWLVNFQESITFFMVCIVCSSVRSVGQCYLFVYLFACLFCLLQRHFVFLSFERIIMIKKAKQTKSSCPTGIPKQPDSLLFNIIFSKTKSLDFSFLHRFPTIYFAPMKSKNTPKKYNMGRDIDSFVQYLKREATNTFTLPEKKKKKTKKTKDEL